jgi:hypothetical protein
MLNGDNLMKELVMFILVMVMKIFSVTVHLVNIGVIVIWKIGTIAIEEV